MNTLKSGSHCEISKETEASKIKIYEPKTYNQIVLCVCSLMMKSFSLICQTGVIHPGGYQIHAAVGTCIQAFIQALM